MFLSMNLWYVHDFIIHTSRIHKTGNSHYPNEDLEQSNLTS